MCRVSRSSVCATHKWVKTHCACAKRTGPSPVTSLTHLTGSWAPPLPLAFSAREGGPFSASPALVALPAGRAESGALAALGEAGEEASAAAAVARSSLTSFPTATGAGAGAAAGGGRGEGGLGGGGGQGGWGVCGEAGRGGVRSETMATMPRSFAMGSLTPRRCGEGRSGARGCRGTGIGPPARTSQQSEGNKGKEAVH